MEESEKCESFKYLEAILNDHLKEYATHREECLLRQEYQDRAHEKNMAAIAALTASTQGVVDAWQTIYNFQKFIKWLGGFSILIAVIVYIIKNIKII